MLYKFYLYKYKKANFQKPGRTPISISDMMYVGCFDTTEFENEGEDNYEVAIESFNGKLRQFLIDNKIKQFLPINKPSIERTETEHSICYYHNQDLYEFMYESLDNKEMVMAPIITNVYDVKYHAYGLDDYWDPRAHTGVDLQESELD